LNAAQRLYEGHKLLTYPRTDSRYLPSDYGETVDKVLASLQTDVAYQDLADSVVEGGPQNIDRVLDGTKVSDHFAIVPTGAEPSETLGADDSRIYDLVVRQFLAALMGPATWATVERTVHIAVPEGDDSVFRTTAKSLEVPGFLGALGQEAGAGRQLPALVPGSNDAVGVTVDVVSLVEEEKLTKPPARHSEGALLRLMETAGERIEDEDLAEAMKGRGLGTPATRADTIERLVRTGYARRIDGKLGPSPKGMRLMDILERLNVPVLADPKLTGQWEHALQQVQEGTRTKQQVLEGLETFTKEITEALTDFDHDTLFASEPALGPCPSCKIGEVVETAWGYRCSRNTQKEAECKLIIWKDRGGRYINRELAELLVKEHKSGRLEGFVSRGGRSSDGVMFLEPDEDTPGSQWTMRIEYGESSGEDVEPEVAVGVVFPCPCDREGCRGVVETNHRFVCSLVLDGVEKKGPVLPRLVCLRPMDVEEAQLFFAEEGRTGFIEGFISRRGRPFKGLLFRKPTGKHGFEFPPRASAKADGEPGKKKKKSKAKRKSKAKSKAKRKSKAKSKAKSKSRAKAKSKSKAKAKSKSKAKAKSKSKAKPKAKSKVKAKPKAKSKVKAKPKAKSKAKVKPKAKSKAKAKPKAAKSTE
jgi:DNA topoisomerase-3